MPGHVARSREPPVILLDRDRNITFCSDAAKAMLDRGDPVSDGDNVLICGDAESDAALTLALSELASLQTTSHVLGQTLDVRRTLRLRRAGGARAVAATLPALHPRELLPGAVEDAQRALLVIHQPGAMNEIAPGLLAAAFNFASRGAHGGTPGRRPVGRGDRDRAAGFDRDYPLAVEVGLEDIGTTRQGDLLRLLLAVSAFSSGRCRGARSHFPPARRSARICEYCGYNGGALRHRAAAKLWSADR
jgi:hypothetical protein